LIDTPLQALDAVVTQCSLVLLMSIGSVGREGIAFDERIYKRIRELKERHPSVSIAVDGGVSEKTIQKLIAAGAERFRVGSAIMKSSDPAKAYTQLRHLATSTL
jgi:ribulose-phosphate 3-epimerase